MSTAAVTAEGVGKAYRGQWALRDCSFQLPAGSVTALVGRNGAGKTTLLRMVAGLARPTEGQVLVGGHRVGEPAALGRVAFVGQDRPLYRGFTVAELCRLGARLNAGWDAAAAEQRIRAAGVDPGQRAGRLSGGQRTQVALALALGKRAEVLLLDEPVADLDPIARDELMRGLMTLAAETEVTLVLSSHVVAELVDVCDHLLLVTDGRLRLAADIPTLLDGHRLLVGPAAAAPVGNRLGPHRVLRSSVTGRQASVLVQSAGPVHDPRWQVH